MILPYSLWDVILLSWLHSETRNTPSTLLKGRIGRIYGLNFGLREHLLGAVEK
jgi:hypothetical protein